jgi:hypothetical protein
MSGDVTARAGTCYLPRTGRDALRPRKRGSNKPSNARRPCTGPEAAGMLVLAPARERRRRAIEETAKCYTVTVDKQMLGVAGGARCRGVGERKYVSSRLRGGLAERIEG